MKNGLAQTNNLKAVIDGGTMAAAGLINLADQSLNLHVTAVLNKALSQQVGGTQVGGFMNTALANNQGELVLPVIVTGTFQHPQVAPDVQQIAKMKLDNLLPTSKNPGQLTTGILGAILGNKNQNGNASGAQPAEGRHRRDSGCDRRQTAATKPAAATQAQPSATIRASSRKRHQLLQPNLGDVLGPGAESEEERGEPHTNAAKISTSHSA